MEVRLANKNDIKDILEIYQEARSFMRASGNYSQWTSDYPGDASIISDLKAKALYVIEDAGEIVGTFYFLVGEDPTYKKIYKGSWLNGDPYGIIHRLASIKKGAGSFCFQWCFQQFPNIKVDTHQDNRPLLNLLDKLGYTRCGIIYLEDGSKRIAFQKSA